MVVVLWGCLDLDLAVLVAPPLALDSTSCVAGVYNTTADGHDMHLVSHEHIHALPCIGEKSSSDTGFLWEQKVKFVNFRSNVSHLRS